MRYVLVCFMLSCTPVADDPSDVVGESGQPIPEQVELVDQKLMELLDDACTDVDKQPPFDPKQVEACTEYKRRWR